MPTEATKPRIVEACGRKFLSVETDRGPAFIDLRHVREIQPQKDSPGSYIIVNRETYLAFLESPEDPDSIMKVLIEQGG